MKAAKFEVFGAVQGVGFRPFVYKLAVDLELKGEVYNDGEGVKIIVCADSARDFAAQNIPANSSASKLVAASNSAEISTSSTSNLGATLPPISAPLKSSACDLTAASKISNLAAIQAPQDLSDARQISDFTEQNLNKASPPHGAGEMKFYPKAPNRTLNQKRSFKTEDEILKEFERRLCSDAPPLCRIDKILRSDLNMQYFTQNFTDFKIIASKNSQKLNPILPDFAICEDCKREFYDPQNPRFRYPFINCTNCGPRLSIIAALPYDRANTTMRAFEMCDFCRGEYTDPLTRRYHAEPISCAHCGPQLFLCGAGGEILARGEEAIARTAELLRRGQIGAIKGMGGFHIVCDATNERAIRQLRVRKNRPDKPFAIMCRDVGQALKIAPLSAEEEALMNSGVKPIVILKKHEFVWRTGAGFTADFGTQNFKDFDGASLSLISNQADANFNLAQKLATSESGAQIYAKTGGRIRAETYEQSCTEAGAQINFKDPHSASQQQSVSPSKAQNSALRQFAPPNKEQLYTKILAKFSTIFGKRAIFIAPSVAPNLDKIGIFLANTGVHLLLFEYFDRPIVATSANISGEPIIFNAEELRAKLGGVISFYLDNDREILTPSDDSIAFVPRFASLVSKSEAAQSISQNLRSPQSAPSVNDQAPQKNCSAEEQNLLQKADVVAAEKQNVSQKLSHIAKEEATQSSGARGLGAQRNLASGAFPCGADISLREPATKRDFMRELLRNHALFLRTSRGMNPKIFPSKFRTKGTFLALGAELKNQFAIYKDGQIFISPYIGDLKNVATNERFFALLDMFVRAYELKFDAVIADLHPQFSHTRFFEQRGYPMVRYQHHFAHLVSNLAQNDLLGSGKKYLGFCFDGTGCGTDGTIWGGEVMIFDPRGYRRVAKFDEIVLLGGENAIKNIYKLALALVFKFNAKNAAREFLAKFDASEVANLEKIAPRAVRSSSLGRLFDAFAAIICGLRTVSFDGEAGMRLENLYIEGCEQSYEFTLRKEGENFIQNAPHFASQRRGVDDLRYETGREAKQGGLNAQNHSGAKNSCALRGDFKKLADDAASKNELEWAAENIAGGGEKNTNVAANFIEQEPALNLINSESKNAADADQAPQNGACAPSLEGECYVIDYEEAFLQALSDEPRLAATKFINGLANFIAEFAEGFGLEVALSGGVFQNATLLNLTCAKLRARGIKFYLNREIPCNDSGIAYGQLAAYLSGLSR